MEGRNKQDRIKSRIRKRGHVAWVIRVEAPDRMMYLIVHEFESGGLREAGCHLVVVCYVEDRILCTT